LLSAIQPFFKANFEQVCIVVNSVDKSIEKMWNTLGIGPWNISNVDASSITNVKYLGKPGRFGFKVGLTQVGGIELELIEPTEGESAYVDFLKKNGEGPHHVCCPRIDTYDNFLKTIQELEKDGFPCIMSGRCPPGNFAYFDTTKVLNMCMEIYWRDPQGYMPPFDYTYPRK
jgi:methylmalonyl-CoA/ethylmalonyl-CoA epimerase